MTFRPGTASDTPVGTVHGGSELAMKRRQFLELGVLGSALVAGCTEGRQPTTAGADEPPPTTTASTRSPTATASPTRTETPREHPDTLFVAPDGSDANPGTAVEPLESIQAALDAVRPGETIRLRPGVHTAGNPKQPVGITKRGGEHGEPITISGPPEAVVRGPPIEGSPNPLLVIAHSHVHLVGMTLDGLTVPSEADDPTRYRAGVVDCSPPTWQASFPDYLRDVKVTPRRVGNARGKLISAWRTNALEIGGFEVIGPAGTGFFMGEQSGHVLGAVISLGRSANNFGTDHYPWTGPDESHDIHVHHIAHLAGHAHTELVKLHGGNHDVTVEYCTDLGGNSRSSVLLPAGDCTIRWCDLRDAGKAGIHVFVPPMKENGAYEAFASIPEERYPGRNNAIYGNRLLNHAGGAIGFSSPEWFDGGPSAQRVLCGNEITGEAQGDPTRACPDDIPTGEGIGHTGGDGPWSEDG